MDELRAIFDRYSVREFADKALEPEKLRRILEAGMSGPSAVNARDWSFIVMSERQTLKAAAQANGKAARPLENAAAGVLVCGDMGRAYAKAKEFWIIDAAIAAQNIVIAATGLGVGSLWLGVWPILERVESQRALFGLPENIVPHSIIALGYPLRAGEPRPNWEEDRVHWERWQQG